MSLLPYADESLVAAAIESLDVSIFRSSAVDQFLSTLAMEWGAEYEGEMDFGTLTRMELDDELRVVLVLASAIADDYASEWAIDNLTSHYRAADVLLGEGNDQRWWADWYAMTTVRATEEWDRFSAAYSEWLGDEEGDDAEVSAHVPGGLLDELRQAENLLD